VREVNVEATPLDHQLDLVVIEELLEGAAYHVRFQAINKHAVSLDLNLLASARRAQNKDATRKALLKLLELQCVLSSLERLHAEGLERLVRDGRGGDD